MEGYPRNEGQEGDFDDLNTEQEINSSRYFKQESKSQRKYQQAFFFVEIDQMTLKFM